MSRIPLSIEGGALEQYLAEISHQERLTREEEEELFARIQEGDEEAKQRLIQGYRRHSR